MIKFHVRRKCLWKLPVSAVFFTRVKMWICVWAVFVHCTLTFWGIRNTRTTPNSSTSDFQYCIVLTLSLFLAQFRFLDLPLQFECLAITLLLFFSEEAVNDSMCAFASYFS